MTRWVVRPAADGEGDDDIFATRDEALEHAIVHAEQGETITVHQPTCRSCSCTPEQVIVQSPRLA